MHNKGLVVFGWIIVACFGYFINPPTNSVTSCVILVHLSKYYILVIIYPTVCGHLTLVSFGSLTLHQTMTHGYRCYRRLPPVLGRTESYLERHSLRDVSGNTRHAHREGSMGCATFSRNPQDDSTFYGPVDILRKYTTLQYGKSHILMIPNYLTY